MVDGDKMEMKMKTSQRKKKKKMVAQPTEVCVFSSEREKKFDPLTTLLLVIT